MIDNEALRGMCPICGRSVEVVAGLLLRFTDHPITQYSTVRCKGSGMRHITMKEED